MAGSRKHGKAGDGDWSRQVSGVRVRMPVEPYGVQLAMMGQILRSIRNAQHCLIESPTGTGKTLALLASTTSWQREQIKLIKQQGIWLPIPKMDHRARTCPSFSCRRREGHGRWTEGDGGKDRDGGTTIDRFITAWYERFGGYVERLA